MSIFPDKFFSVAKRHINSSLLTPNSSLTTDLCLLITELN